ncbi:MAG: redoxin domain-containing protein [Bacteroidia bacterium]|nr:redoxin domain-containing protein [Bacteroidia bacterium]
MKSLPIRFFLLLNLMSIMTVSAQRAVLSGNITNAKVDFVKAGYRKSLVGYDDNEKDFRIDKKGNFKIVLDLKKEESISITIDEQYTKLYLQPGDSMHVKIDYSDFDNSLIYSGRNSEKNMFLKDFNNRFVYGHEQEVYQRLANSKTIDFRDYCDSLLVEKKKFLYSWKGTSDLDKHFISIFSEDLDYENASLKLSYPGMWSYFRKFNDSVPEMPYSYFSFIADIPQKPAGAPISHKYFEYASSLVENALFNFHHRYNLRLTAKEQVAIARTILKNEEVFKAYEALTVLNSLENRKFKEAENFYLDYVKENPNSPYLEKLKETYLKIERLSPGKPAPGFALMDEKGKERKLEEFKGKIIYLDFWASWCGPCIRELPFSKKLKTDFEGKDVVFLNISIDDNEKSWKDALQKHGMSGVNLLAPTFNNKICEAYNVVGIPAYFLINRDGTIYDNNPPRPSDEAGVRMTLNAALGN